MPDAPQGQRHDRSALILYGSETGNSQDAAEELGRVAERLHFVTRVSEMDRVEISMLLKVTVVIFVVSTTGQGEFPKNAQKFWKSLLRKRLPPDCLSHVSFTTFGLGDSSYPKYNWTARKLHKRLEQLGAKEIYPRGEGDEQHPEGNDGTFLSWSVDLGKHLLSSYPLPEGVTPIPSDVLLPFKTSLEILENSNSIDSLSKMLSAEMDLDERSSATSTPTPTMFFPSSPRAPMVYTPPADPEPEPSSPDCAQLKEPHPDTQVPVDFRRARAARLPIPNECEVIMISNERLTPDTHWQDVRELTFLMLADYDYKPGESVTIFPHNFPDDVQTLIDLQGWNDVADMRVRVKPEAPDWFLDEGLMSQAHDIYPLENTTFRQLLTYNLDFTAIPKRHFFSMIALYTDNPMHRERLLEFADQAFTEELYDYTTRPRRSILEVLQDFPSVKIPWKYATSFFPAIRGRDYSLATGGVQQLYARDARYIQFQIIVALVKYRTVLKKVRHGLCSRYLASLAPNTNMHVSFNTQASKFYDLAKDSPQLPLILIAPGTGLAPVRSLIWEREEQRTAAVEVGKSYLFYGGRNRDADYFYAHEWHQRRSLQVLPFTAFSRDQPQKIYVQDIIRKEGELVERLIRKEQAIIYVCGSSGKMPIAVREALIDVCTEHNPDGRSREHIKRNFDELERHGRYIQETW